MKYTLSQAQDMQEAGTCKTGEFTKANATVAYACIEMLWKALPRSKKQELVGEANEAMLFVAAAEKKAPDK